VISGLLLALAVLCWPERRVERAVRALAGHAQNTWHQAAGPAASPADGRRWRAPAARRLLRRLVGTRDGSGGAGTALPLLDELAAALRAGLSPAEALAGVLAASPRSAALLGPVLEATHEGRSAGAALHRSARRTADADLTMAARVWVLSERTGAPLADGITAAARGGRARLEHRRRVATATAGARASIVLLSVLPAGGIGIGMLLGLPPGRLYGTPLALSSLALGLGLLLLGRAVAGRMVRRVESVNP